LSTCVDDCCDHVGGRPAQSVLTGTISSSKDSSWTDSNLSKA
jgi:hypothetical protein